MSRRFMSSERDAVLGFVHDEIDDIAKVVPLFAVSPDSTNIILRKKIETTF